jgi:hypothetical protein
MTYKYHLKLNSAAFVLKLKENLILELKSLVYFIDNPQRKPCLQKTSLPPMLMQQHQADSRSGSGGRRRHGLEVEDEEHIKDLVVIFFFIEVLYTVRCFSLTSRSFLAKEKDKMCVA